MDKEALIKRTLEDLGKHYPIGLYEYLFKHRHEVYSKLTRLEKAIDQAFLTGMVEDLKAILRDYWRLHMEAIKQFKAGGQLTLNIRETREEMEEERVRA